MGAYLNNLQDKISFEQDLPVTLTKLLEFVMEKEKVFDYEIGVSLVDDRAISELNAKYRKVNAPTDVLSFPLSDDGEPLTGDIVISMEAVLRQSQDYGHSLLREVAYLLVHGLYHILGFSHDEPDEKLSMRLKEEEALRQFGIQR
jgi:probable rRNA maturation factor